MVLSAPGSVALCWLFLNWSHYLQIPSGPFPGSVSAETQAKGSTVAAGSGQLSCLITAFILTSYCSSDTWALEGGRGTHPSPRVLVYFSSSDSMASSLSSPLTTSSHSVCAYN